MIILYISVPEFIAMTLPIAPSPSNFFNTNSKFSDNFNAPYYLGIGVMAGKSFKRLVLKTDILA